MKHLPTLIALFGAAIIVLPTAAFIFAPSEATKTVFIRKRTENQKFVLHPKVVTNKKHLTVSM